MVSVVRSSSAKSGVPEPPMVSAMVLPSLVMAWQPTHWAPSAVAGGEP